MVEKNIEEHIKPEIQRYKSIHIHRTSRIEVVPRGSQWITDRNGRIRMEKEWYNFSDEIHRFMNDIPRIKSQKSPEIHPKQRNYHYEWNQYPRLRTVVMTVPIGMQHFQWGKSRNQSRNRHHPDINNIEMKHCSVLVEMDKIGPDIETIREKEKPEKEKYTLPPSRISHRKECKKIWNQSEDEIPDESTEFRRAREKYSNDRKNRTKQTKGNKSRIMEWHRKNGELCREYRFIYFSQILRILNTFPCFNFMFSSFKNEKSPLQRGFFLGGLFPNIS